MRQLRNVRKRPSLLRLQFIRRHCQRLFANACLPGFSGRTLLGGLYEREQLLSPDELYSFSKSVGQIMGHWHDESESQALRTFYPETGKTAYEGIQVGEELYTDTETELRGLYFSDYHQGSQVKNGLHRALTYPSQIPKFVKPVVDKLAISNSKVGYVFLNEYILPQDVAACETLFDWHVDLRRFGDPTIIFGLFESATLQLVPLTAEEIQRKPDGFQSPERASDPNAIIDIEIKPNHAIALTGPARHEYAHRVVMPPGTHRMSLALGYKSTTPTR